MRDRVEFDHLPPTPERLIWCEWLRRHGIDPSHVAVAFIERQEDTCRIVYATYEVVYTQVPVRPEVSPFSSPSTWFEVPEYRIEREMRLVDVVFQLEAKPLPWPPVPPWPKDQF